ncbi:hypothetical protein Ocin01_13481 [Orchesella cincta]|uniref:Uncharacterized protein n=1 Tax=Orchesella cincta TaxID=48709 RepID=A0A1D2MJM2_ORCCI|nr:hypothetical protein Ocin01_13481 [Orchesella cincta]
MSFVINSESWEVIKRKTEDKWSNCSNTRRVTWTGVLGDSPGQEGDGFRFRKSSQEALKPFSLSFSWTPVWLRASSHRLIYLAPAIKMAEEEVDFSKLSLEERSTHKI